MSPYINNVMAANAQQAAKAQLQGTNQLNAQATQASAFGGSRAGVAQGVMMANNQQNLANQNASLLAGGYQGAMQQAGTLANLGFNGAQLNTQLGAMGVGNGLWGLNALRSGYIQPTGGTSGGAQTTVGGQDSFGFL